MNTITVPLFPPRCGLTPREREFLELLQGGLREGKIPSDGKLAAAMRITEGSVVWLQSKIAAKLLYDNPDESHLGNSYVRFRLCLVNLNPSDQRANTVTVPLFPPRRRKLAPREREILGLLQGGLREGKILLNEELAALMKIKGTTVKTYLWRIAAKFLYTDPDEDRTEQSGIRFRLCLLDLDPSDQSRPVLHASPAATTHNTPTMA